MADFTDQKTNRLFALLQRNKLKKLANLLLKKERASVPVQQSAELKLAPAFINLSNVAFSEEEIDLLSKGKKFAVPPASKVRQLSSIIVADITDSICLDTRLSISYLLIINFLPLVAMLAMLKSTNQFRRYF